MKNKNGFVYSSSNKFAVPLTSENTGTSDYEYTDRQKINITEASNQKK